MGVTVAVSEDPGEASSLFEWEEGVWGAEGESEIDNRQTPSPTCKSPQQGSDDQKARRAVNGRAGVDNRGRRCGFIP